MQSRREFIARSLKGTSLVSLAGAVPMFIPRTLPSATASKDDRILVVVELAGGNDGINTLVPFRDEGYARHRKQLCLPKDQLIRIDDDLALHPSMRSMAEIWNRGQLAIIQGVGYPNPNRSHFRSMEIWHTATDASQEHDGVGWIGKGLDSVSRVTNSPLCLSVGQQATPLALRGSRTISSSVHRVDQYAISEVTGASLRPESSLEASTSHDLLQFVRRTQLTALQTAADLQSVPRRRSNTSYSNTRFGRQLELTAQLIRAGMPTRVYYTQQDGYDTHSGQLPQHAILLRNFSDSLSAFLQDLTDARLEDRVIVMAFSEFGRRVSENGTAGTDHGTAGPVFVAGSGVVSGLHATTPSLVDLEDGDLKMSVDFRSIYASILEQWLQVPSGAALGKRFERLPILQG